MATYRFSFPTTIHFGSGVRSMLGGYFKAQGLRRPLVVTDRGVAGLPFLKEIVATLEKGGIQCTVFSEVWGNPVKSQVTAGVEAYRNAKADSMIGIGGERLWMSPRRFW